jgi:hypothetical protein
MGVLFGKSRVRVNQDAKEVIHRHNVRAAKRPGLNEGQVLVTRKAGELDF